MTSRRRASRRNGSSTRRNMRILSFRGIRCHGHSSLVGISFGNGPAQLGHIRSSIVRFATRGSRRGVVEIARWGRDWMGWWTIESRQRSRSRRIGIESGRRHRSTQVPWIRILGRRAWSRIQALGSRISESTPRSWVRSRLLLRLR